MLFLSGQDFGEGGLGKARLIGHAVFKYNFTTNLAGIVETGWGWNAYEDTDQETLAVVIPTTAGIEYRFHAGATKVWPHLAAGGGIYYLGIKDDPRSYAEAGDNTRRLTWTSPGVYGKLGAEYLFDDGVSLNLDLLVHQIFSKKVDRFGFTPRVINRDDYPTEQEYQDALAEEQARGRFSNTWGVQNTSFAEIRFGVNYYFTLKQTGPAPPSGN